jgi:imidazolonepropionase-like amidohydrolase
MAKLHTVVAVFAILAGLLPAESYRFGHVWDGERMLTNAVIVIENGRIKSVGALTGGDGIDMSRYTALPGLIDVHTHMTFLPRSLPAKLTDAGRAGATVYLSQEAAKKTLEAGVTTVRNLNARNYDDIAMRDLINAGLMVGPRMFVSGYGLHITRNDVDPGTADGPAEVLKAVRRQVAAGVDVIKMFASTGSGQDVTGFQTFTYEEIKAAVDTAHALGKKIAIHSYGPTGARDAIRAGADSVEHATNMDDETIQEMARNRIFYVPTIDHNRFYADNATLLGFPPDSIGRLNDYIAHNLETTKKAFKAGVRFAMGSDAVGNMFGENTRELGWFIKAGMTPEQALKAATVDAAALLGMQDKLGYLKPDYYADITAVEGDPLVDINAIVQNVRWVMKGGAVVVDKTRPN